MSNSPSDQNIQPQNDTSGSATLESIVLGAGCFWCVEAQFELLDGVVSAESGYAGGHTINPSYKEVCTGNTGHAEVIKLVFDTSKISLKEVIEAFFETHDPTSLNRQGNDIGTQYRSVIFYNDEHQKQVAQSIIDTLNANKVFDSPIVTEVTALTDFYPAEDYHQQYFDLNGTEPYCTYVIKPKYDKFKKIYKDKIKK